MVPKVRNIDNVFEPARTLLTIDLDSPVAQAAAMMNIHQVGCLLVLDKNRKMVGILSERDMLSRALAGSAYPEETVIRQIMTDNVVSCTPDTPVATVEQLMAEHRIRHMPVISDDVPVAMVSSRDIIAYRLKTNIAMKDAAEKLAKLTAGLKSLDLNEVLELIIAEVPACFHAEWAVLYFPQKGSSHVLVHEKGCPLSAEHLSHPKNDAAVNETPSGLCGNLCHDCQRMGGLPPRLLIPLTISDNARRCGDPALTHEGFLCMCRFDSADVQSDEILLYKATLLQEILNANLTNAYLYRKYRKARQDSCIDPLTGVGTRRVLEKALKTEYHRALRYGTPFSIVVLDVDSLKEINDRFGHDTGDVVLRQAAETMARTVRNVDIVTRYGGDEFVILLPETKLDGAARFLARLQSQLRYLAVADLPPVTLSCGAAEWIKEEHQHSPESVLSDADNALYQAKKNGRDCIVLHNPTPTPL